MGRDGCGEGDVQPAPGLSLLLPGLDLVRLYPWVGQQERGGGVVPHGVAAEVGYLHGVPTRGEIVSGKRCAGINPLLDDGAAGGLDRDPFGVDVEHQVAVGGGERRVNEVLAPCVEVNGLIDQQVGPAFHAPKRAAERQAHAERMDG